MLLASGRFGDKYHIVGPDFFRQVKHLLRCGCASLDDWTRNFSRDANSVDSERYWSCSLWEKPAHVPTGSYVLYFLVFIYSVVLLVQSEYGGVVSG